MTGGYGQSHSRCRINIPLHELQRLPSDAEVSRRSQYRLPLPHAPNTSAATATIIEGPQTPNIQPSHLLDDSRMCSRSSYVPTCLQWTDVLLSRVLCSPLPSSRSPSLFILFSSPLTCVLVILMFHHCYSCQSLVLSSIFYSPSSTAFSVFYIILLYSQIIHI